MDRAHRLGQKRSVSVFRLISRGTLEEKIMSLQRFKTHVAGAVVNAENASLQSMSTEEAPREHTGATPRPHLGYTSATPRLRLAPVPLCAPLLQRRLEELRGAPLAQGGVLRAEDPRSPR